MILDKDTSVAILKILRKAIDEIILVLETKESSSVRTKYIESETKQSNTNTIVSEKEVTLQQPKEEQKQILVDEDESLFAELVLSVKTRDNDPKEWREVKFLEFIQKEWLKEICREGFDKPIEWDFGTKIKEGNGFKKTWSVLTSEREHKLIQNTLNNEKLWAKNRDRIGEIVREQQKRYKK